MVANSEIRTILFKEIEELALKARDFEGFLYSTSVVAYVAGRYPQLTILSAWMLIEDIRSELFVKYV